MQRESRVLDRVRRYIERHFGFLFEQGFALVYADYSAKYFGNWIVTLTSPVCSVLISNDRSFIGLEFLPAGEGDPWKRVTLEQILIHAGKNKEMIEPVRRSLFFEQKRQLERLARLLEKYLDVVRGYYAPKTP